MGAKSQELTGKSNDPSKSELVGALDPASGVSGQSFGYWLGALLVVCALCAFMFAPTVANLVAVWNAEQDYSHGFLVAPFAAMMLWFRRQTFPADSTVPGWGGLVLLLASVVVRYAGERLFLVPLGGWALVIWLAGAVWLVAGRRVATWAMPALLFLLFMVPLPFRIEQLMSWHLQTSTTQISTVILECLGQPAVAQGHTVYVGEHVLEVEQACSGLRMFMGISAVAFAFVVLQRRPWWESLVLVVAVVPIAMLANSIRVVITGLMMQVVSGEAAAQFTHDAAGWVTIVCAAGFFTMLAAYLRGLIVAVDMDTGRELLRRPLVS